MLRLKSSLNTWCATALAALVITAGVLAQAPKPTDKPATPPSVTAPVAPDNIQGTTSQQEQNAKVYREFEAALLRLAQKLEKSDKPEDQARGKTIRAALEVAEKAGVANQFKGIIEGMRTNPNKQNEFEVLLGKDKELAAALKDILDILMTDDESARLKAEIARLEAFLKEIKDVKRRQEIARALAEAQKGDAERQAKNQGNLAKETQDIAARMGAKKDAGQDKEATAKATPKGEPKPGENAGDPKADAGDAKADAKESKEGQASEGKPMAGEGKPSDGSPKPSDGAKEGGESKPQDKGPEASEPKAGPDAKKPESSQPKNEGQGKGEDKPSKGQPSAGEGKPMGGKPSDGEASPKGEGQGKPPSPGSGSPSAGGPPKPQTPGRKNVEEAFPHQKAAEEDLNKDQKTPAAKKQDKAIEELAKAIQELEKRLKQLREEEKAKLLANLEARCNRMLAMQIEVYQATKSIHETILRTKETTNADRQKAQQQSDKEGEIVADADKALKLLETEGSAVAFARVLEEVRVDMAAVQKRLGVTMVDGDTQGIEENIIAMLKDMIQALKKAQQDMQANKDNNNNNNNNNNKPNNKLIELLAELKLIRSMQAQVNSRTTMYSKKSPGEQTNDPIVSEELKQLSTRQTKLQDMLNKIASGANQ